MPSVTVDEIITRARSAADMRDDFVTQSEWIAWFNVERQWLDVFIARHGYVLAEAQVAITTTSGVAQYPLSDMLAILGVFELSVQGYFREIKPTDSIGTGNAGHIVAPGIVVGPASKYRAFQNTGGVVTIEFYPTPPAGSNYLVYTIPMAARATDTTATVNYPAGFEERIVLGMARRALAKEETTNSALEREVTRVESLVEEVAQDRAFGAFQHVRNVDRRERGWVKYPEIPTRERWQFF